VHISCYKNWKIGEKKFANYCDSPKFFAVAMVIVSKLLHNEVSYSCYVTTANFELATTQIFKNCN